MSSAVDQGATFWDQFPTEGGRLVTAEDIRWNVQRNIDGVDATGVEDGTFLGSSTYRKTASIEVVDETTITMKTDGPDATYLAALHAGPFSWMTSPEAGDAFGDRWRDETVNVELSSGTGQFIPVSFDPDSRLLLKRNPNHFRAAADGGQLPYLDNVEWANLTDATAVEAAYRSQQIDHGNFPLSKLQVEGILGDFPDHEQNQVAFGFVIVSLFNYSQSWDGVDGQGNPWLDRRVAQAWNAAQDRFFMGETVYLGDYKLSALNETPWFDDFWAIPQDELLTIPGWRPDRDADIAEARRLLDAAGFDRDFDIMMPDLWGATYPGIIEATKAMYETALDRTVNIDIQPYSVILQVLVEHTHPGSGPAWGNPPADLDPTTLMGDFYKPEGSANFWSYDYQPVTDLIDQMTVTLDAEERRELGLRVQRILLGTDAEHGSEGFGPNIGTMNGIQLNVTWPYVNTPPDAQQFVHASHHRAATWMDTSHPQYPA